MGKILLIGGAVILIDHITAPLMLTGTFVFLVGLVMYMVFKVQEMLQNEKEGAEAKQAPTESTPLNKDARAISVPDDTKG